MVKLFSKVIAERRAKGEEHDDVLQVFMESQYRDGSTVNDEQITGLMIALLFAGQHTSSITSSWTGLHLLANPEYMYAYVRARVSPCPLVLIHPTPLLFCRYRHRHGV